MRTFWIATLGCKVNQYESEQIATLLRSRGLALVESPAEADLRVINTCSVTIQAASKSRQTVRQAVGPPVLGGSCIDGGCPRQLPRAGRTIVVGCWASSDPEHASSLGGVSAVIGHRDDVAGKLDRLITLWQSEDSVPPAKTTEPEPRTSADQAESASTLARSAGHNKAQSTDEVKEKDGGEGGRGTVGLPLLGGHQSGHQRAFLKIQDGCDAHCTYCIIPKLRPVLWSKPIEDVVREAQRLVDAGHLEIVLTGIFLGAYGQETALRRRQRSCAPAGVQVGQAPPYVSEAGVSPLARVIEAMCKEVREMRRLRLSSLEPGDLTEELIGVLRSHEQAVPHFHLPLQSGSDLLLRRMNRQYGRDEYLRMIDRVREAFDRPAITTDIIVGFPGESDEEFERTMEVAEAAGFIHIHAFPFSPRPGTAAARWTDKFVRGPVVNERIERLGKLAERHSLEFRRRFVGETMEVMVERPTVEERTVTGPVRIQHGRCARYFSVHFEHPESLTGKCVAVMIDRVASGRTHGTIA